HHGCYNSNAVCTLYRHLHSFPTRRSSDLTRRKTQSLTTRPGEMPPEFKKWLPAVSRFLRSARHIPGANLTAAGCSLAADVLDARSEEHTSELQSRENLVCRLLLAKQQWPL